MHSAKILPPPATPLRSWPFSFAASPTLCRPVIVIRHIGRGFLPPPVAPHPGPSVSQPVAVSASVFGLFSPTVRRRFRALRRLVGLQLPRLERRYRDSCVVAGAGSVQRPFVGVG